MILTVITNEFTKTFENLTDFRLFQKERRLELYQEHGRGYINVPDEYKIEIKDEKRV